MDSPTELDEELAHIRARAGRRDAIRRVLFTAVLAVIPGLTIAFDAEAASRGETAAVCRVILAILGLASAAAIWFRPLLAWRLACAWALIQIPYYAWSPQGGSPTAQAAQLTFTITNSQVSNEVLVDYSQVGINLVGAILFLWLRWWRASLVPRLAAPAMAPA